MRERLSTEGVQVYDIEFMVFSEDFIPGSLVPMLEAAYALGARRLSVCAAMIPNTSAWWRPSRHCAISQRHSAWVWTWSVWRGARPQACLKPSELFLKQAGRVALCETCARRP